MSNGNVNNNNKNNDNNNYALGVSEFQSTQMTDAPLYTISEESLRQAYFLCLKNKKSTVSAVTFRVDELQNVRRLWEEISSGVYYPGTSIAFITENREVFAADFRDRVVHTWIAMRIIPLLEAQFVPTTWNCRKGKGVFKAVESLRVHIREVSQDYTRDAWIMTYDLSGFFMGIDREKAAGRICRFVDDRYRGEDKETLLWLLRMILTHAPEKDCIKIGSEEEWSALPRRKSLFFRPGLPIGDLPSQLVGNFELDVVDHFINRITTCDRYVDDTARVSENKQTLLDSMPAIREMLSLTCGASVNPHKYKFVHWRDGFKYLGIILRGDKATVSGKIAGRAYDVIRHYNGVRKKERCAQDFVNRLNSYLGLMKHYDTLEMRQRLVGMISPAWREHLVITDEKILVKHPRRKQMSADLRTMRKNFNNLKYSIKCKHFANVSPLAFPA